MLKGKNSILNGLHAAPKKLNFVMTQFVNQGLVDELSNWTLPPVEAVEDRKKGVKLKKLSPGKMQ